MSGFVFSGDYSSVPIINIYVIRRNVGTPSRKIVENGSTYLKNISYAYFELCYYEITPSELSGRLLQ